MLVFFKERDCPKAPSRRQMTSPDNGVEFRDRVSVGTWVDLSATLLGCYYFCLLGLVIEKWANGLHVV